MQEDSNTLDGNNHPSVTLGQLGQGLAYWIELTDFVELLKGFGKTSEGLLVRTALIYILYQISIYLYLVLYECMIDR